MTTRSILSALALVMAALLAVAFALPPIAQDPAYHAFADSRAMFGIPNALDVLSNAAFLVIGIMGLAFVGSARPPGARASWLVFFGGVTLVAFGSAYYHWAPGDAPLVWDRLPITISFMALSAAVVSEHADAALERFLLPAALAIGVVSVAWWRYSGDLRLYVWVQFAPLAGLLVLLALSPGRYGGRAFLIAAFVCYVCAKVAELLDPRIFAATSGIVSGHTLKHLLAALTPVCIYLMLRRRCGASRSLQ